MKYDSMRKTQRNQAVVRMHQEHPELALKEIGQIFGISNQRVWQIVQKYGTKAA